jgi:hypothetical protein
MSACLHATSFELTPGEYRRPVAENGECGRGLSLYPMGRRPKRRRRRHSLERFSDRPVESLRFMLPSEYSAGNAYRSNRCCISPTDETDMWMDGPERLRKSLKNNGLILE